MKKTVITSFIILGLILSCFTTKADGSFVYHSSVQEGETFTWEIQTNVALGVNMELESDLELTLPAEDGDVFAVEILDDPSDPSITNPFSNDLLDFTLNGVDIGLEWLALSILMMMYGAEAYIVPLTHHTTNISAVPYNLQDLATDFNALDDVTALVVEGSSLVTLRVENDWEIEGVEAETSYQIEYNTTTGFMRRFLIEADNGNSVEYFRIVSEFYEPLPFNWIFAVSSILFVGLVIVIIKRRK